MDHLKSIVHRDKARKYKKKKKLKNYNRWPTILTATIMPIILINKYMATLIFTRESPESVVV